MASHMCQMDTFEEQLSCSGAGWDNDAERLRFLKRLEYSAPRELRVHGKMAYGQMDRMVADC